MPSYVIAEGRRASIGGKTREAGETLTLDADDAAKLLRRGILVQTGRGAGRTTPKAPVIPVGSTTPLDPDKIPDEPDKD